MNTLMVRSRIKSEHVAELEAAAKRVFAALQQAQPNGIRYASCRLPDGVTYVAVLEFEDGVDNPSPRCRNFTLSRRVSKPGWPNRRPPSR